MKITLSDDGSRWAELRDPRELTNGQRKPFMRLIASFPLKPDGSPDMDKVAGETILQVGELLLAAFVSAWSFGPLPSEDAEALDNIPAMDYDRLQAEAGKLMDELTPKDESSESPTP